MTRWRAVVKIGEGVFCITAQIRWGAASALIRKQWYNRGAAQTGDGARLAAPSIGGGARKGACLEARRRRGRQRERGGLTGGKRKVGNWQ